MLRKQFSVFLFLLFLQSPSLGAPNIVSVHLHRTVSTHIVGLGVQWDPYEYQPSAQNWRIILQRMRFCKPAWLRVMWMATDYCKGFRADGSPEYVWQKGFSADRTVLNQLCAILSFAQKQHIRVLLGEWAPPRGLIRTETSKVWARITADLLQYLRSQRGYTCIRYYNVINEPNGNWSGNKDYATWVQVVKNLAAELHKRKLDREVRIIGPDTTGNTQWLEPFHWLNKAAADLPQQIGAWDLHWYALDPEVYNDSIEKLLRKKKQMLLGMGPNVAQKHVFLGESGLLTGRINGDQQPRVKTFGYGVMMADYAAQTFRAGWEGASAWDMDDAMHTVHGHPAVPGPLTLKVWGFWNSQGAVMGDPQDFKPRPWFYTWSLMCRLFPRGSSIVQTSEPNLPQFRAAAALTGAGSKKQFSVMLVNNSDSARVITLQIPGLAAPVRCTEYRYFRTVHPVDRQGFAVPYALLHKANVQQGIRILLPSRGVVFLTGPADAK